MGLLTFDLVNINLHCNCRAKMAASFKLPSLVKSKGSKSHLVNAKHGKVINLKDILRGQ